MTHIPDRPSAQPAWHSLPAEDVLGRLSSSHAGLPQEEAEARLRVHGPNRLPEPRRRGPLLALLAQFHNVLIYVLLIAGIGTAVLGHWIDAAVILGVVLINAAVGFVQEGKAERALEAIQGLLNPSAVVLRDGHRREIAADTLVPGDIVMLQPGDKVPADLRIVHAKGLRIQEALLTGESVPSSKSTDPVSVATPLAERRCMAYSGTLVAAGQGSGVVVGTGSGTEIGRINQMLAELPRLTTPLLRQVARFGRQLTAAILVLACFTFAFGVLVHGFSAAEMFVAAVGLAVAAIPEGLPAIMTITLAIGVQRMARRNAIIRRLPAVETLGSVSVICSDKTGTLTRNEMTVRTAATPEWLYHLEGVGYAPVGALVVGGVAARTDEHPELQELARTALLCSDAELTERNGQWVLTGDPMEGALLALAGKLGLDPDRERARHPRLDAIPFESEQRFMASLHHDHHGHTFVIVKGAPERVLQMCNRQRLMGDDEVLDLPRWHAAVDMIAARGERVLAIAFKASTPEHRELSVGDVEGGFTLLGMTGLIDPPRDEAKAAVRHCRSAGIAVKMITGDHAATAAAIGGQLSLRGDRVVSGEEIDRSDEEALKELAAGADVFARTAPEHKLRLVGALQSLGNVVAMTGDGVNDAPALKRADVGVAMGRKGTEAAKEAAEMVLADDNFASITHAVEEGRTVYDNLKKAILFILPTNGGEALVMIAAIVLGLALPITAKQILWVNMITAVTLALALAFEPAEDDVMRRPPRRPDERLLSGFLVWRIALVSSILLAAVLTNYLWELSAGADIAVARTVAVNTLVMGEIVYLFNIRQSLAAALSLRHLADSRAAWVAVALVVIWQVLFTYAPPMQLLFDTGPLGAGAWGRVAAAGAALFMVVELEKMLLRSFRRR